MPEEAAAPPATSNAKGKKAAPKTNGESATNTAAANAADGDKGKRKFNKRDETPIEELFDLSQPIPKVRFFFTVWYIIWCIASWMKMQNKDVESCRWEWKWKHFCHAHVERWDTLYLRLLVDSLCTDPTFVLACLLLAGG